jgi:hypothetical protein
MLATERDDHWAGFECSTRLALLEIDAGDLTAAAPLVDSLRPAADRLGPGGSEATYASAIVALYRLRHETWAPDAFVAEVAALDAIDARFLVPDLTNSAAIIALRLGRLDDATTFATRAVDVATAVDKPYEAARGHAVLACVAAARGESDAAASHASAARALGRALPASVRDLLHVAETLHSSAE